MRRGSIVVWIEREEEEEGEDVIFIGVEREELGEGEEEGEREGSEDRVEAEEEEDKEEMGWLLELRVDDSLFVDERDRGYENRLGLEGVEREASIELSSELIGEE
jgi:hypothetical protein